MSHAQPVEIVLSFIDRINAHDVEGLRALMAEDHRFLDAEATEIRGAEAMRDAWERYFALFPDYYVSPEDVLEKDGAVLITGTAAGTFAAGGKLLKENHWQVPAAWKAVVRDGRIAEWRVYADNRLPRKIMGWRDP